MGRPNGASLVWQKHSRNDQATISKKPHNDNPTMSESDNDVHGRVRLYHADDIQTMYRPNKDDWQIEMPTEHGLVTIWTGGLDGGGHAGRGGDISAKVPKQTVKPLREHMTVLKGLSDGSVNLATNFAHKIKDGRVITEVSEE